MVVKRICRPVANFGHQALCTSLQFLRNFTCTALHIIAAKSKAYEKDRVFPNHKPSNCISIAFKPPLVAISLALWVPLDLNSLNWILKLFGHAELLRQQRLLRQQSCLENLTLYNKVLFILHDCLSILDSYLHFWTDYLIFSKEPCLYKHL